MIVVNRPDTRMEYRRVNVPLLLFPPSFSLSLSLSLSLYLLVYIPPIYVPIFLFSQFFPHFFSPRLYPVRQPRISQLDVESIQRERKRESERADTPAAGKAEARGHRALFMILLTRKRVPLTSDARNPVPDRSRRI